MKSQGRCRAVLLSSRVRIQAKPRIISRCPLAPLRRVSGILRQRFRQTRLDVTYYTCSYRSYRPLTRSHAPSLASSILVHTRPSRRYIHWMMGIWIMISGPLFYVEVIYGYYETSVGWLGMHQGLAMIVPLGLSPFSVHLCETILNIWLLSCLLQIYMLSDSPWP